VNVKHPLRRFAPATSVYVLRVAGRECTGWPGTASSTGALAGVAPVSSALAALNATDH